MTEATSASATGHNEDDGAHLANVRDAAAHREVGEILGPVKLRAADGGVLSFFGTFAIFDTPFEVTTSELAIELLFPADRVTAEALERRARERGAG